MWILILTVVVLGGILIRMLWQRKLERRILSEFAEALENRHPYLEGTESGLIRDMGMDRIIHAYSEALTNERAHKKACEDNREELRNLIESIPGIVFSLDPSNDIVHDNQAARDCFNNGISMTGLPIESCVSSSNLLRCIYQSKSTKGPRRDSVKWEGNGKDRWFDINSNWLPPTPDSTRGSILFVLHDITPLKHAETVKDNFVANVSHELKTPITIIKGFSETLSEDMDTLDPGTIRRFVGKIQSNAERLHLLVEDLLTLSRMTAETDYLKKSDQSLSNVVKPLVESYRTDNPDLTILEEGNGWEANVRVDSLKISQVFSNLIDNSIRYAGPDSEIRIRMDATPENHQLLCSVSDNGPGVSSSELSEIFRRFYRADKSRSQSSGGSGLGLSIARGIIDLHGGSMHAEHVSPHGLKVCFSLPLNQ